MGESIKSRQAGRVELQQATHAHTTPPTAAKAVETAESWNSSSNSIIIEEQTQNGGVPAIHWGAIYMWCRTQELKYDVCTVHE